MRKVETKGIGANVGAFLGHVRTQHLAEGGMKQVRGRVVAIGQGSAVGINVGRNRRSVFQQFINVFIVRNQNRQVILFFCIADSNGCL